VTAADEPPDFAAQAKDPAFGRPVPEGKVYARPQQLRFEGYTTDKAGLPTFRYVVHAGASQPTQVSESPEPLRAGAGVGVRRRFTLQVPARQTPWLCAGETTREPRLLDANANPLPLDLKPGTVEIPGAGRLLALPQTGDRVTVLALASAPEGSRWLLRRRGGGWEALLRLPPLTEAGTIHVSLNVWAPYRDEPGLLKELLQAK
jgi:hypothetical protein